MMQITVDPAGLSQEQREAVAGFIMAYPKAKAGSLIDLIPVREAARGEVLPSEAAAAGTSAASILADTSYVAGTALESPELAFGSAAVAVPLPAGAVAVTPAPSVQPAAAVTAPVTVPAPPAPVTGTLGVVVDKAGLPWDGRIHSSNKQVIADGTWRKKRGVEADVVASVEAELRAVMAAPAPAAPAPAAPAPAAPAPAAPAENPMAAYIALVGKASAAVQANKLSQADISEACAAVGIPALPLLATRPDLVPAVDADITARIAAKG